MSATVVYNEWDKNGVWSATLYSSYGFRSEAVVETGIGNTKEEALADLKTKLEKVYDEAFVEEKKS